MTTNLPLADVKILDFMWAIAGPASTRMLADYGATVVRVESTHRFDATRTVGPFHDGRPGAEASGLFFNMNAGKRMLTLDLSKKKRVTWSWISCVGRMARRYRRETERVQVPCPQLSIRRASRRTSL